MGNKIRLDLIAQFGGDAGEQRRALKTDCTTCRSGDTPVSSAVRSRQIVQRVGPGRGGSSGERLRFVRPKTAVIYGLPSLFVSKPDRNRWAVSNAVRIF